MSPALPSPLDIAAQLAEHLPAEELESLATAAAGGHADVLRLKGHSSSPVVRSACDDILGLLRLGTDESFIAGALLGAGRCVDRQRELTGVDVVWTSPPSAVTSSRLTSAVAVDLINSAREEILLISFATVPNTALVAALHAATDRGVFLTLLLERPADNPRYSSVHPALDGLPARRLAWPIDRRPQGAAIHAKVIVVDRTTALVGSANLTGHAMDRNLECGILLRGGPHPERIQAHVSNLLERDELIVV